MKSKISLPGRSRSRRISRRANHSSRRARDTRATPQAITTRMATALATVGAVSAAGMAPRVRRGTAAKLNAGRAFREGETSTCGLRGKRAGARRAARRRSRGGHLRSRGGDRRQGRGGVWRENTRLETPGGARETRRTHSLTWPCLFYSCRGVARSDEPLANNADFRFPSPSHNVSLSQVDKIQKMLAKPYKAGFKTEIEADTIPKGLSEETVRLISAKRRSPSGCSSSASRLPQVADDGRAGLERQPLPRHRLPGGVLLQRAKVMEKKKSLDRWTPSFSRRSTSSASRCPSRSASATSPWTPCSIRCLSPPPSGRISPRLASSSATSPRRSRSTRSHQEAPGQRRPRRRQLLQRTQRRRLLRRLLLLHP